MEEAAAAFKAQDYDKAVFLYGGVIDQCKASSDAGDTLGRALNNRSGALCALGRFEEALSDAKACSTLNPQLAKAWARAAAALHGLGRFAEAARCYSEAATRTDRKGAADPAEYQKLNQEMTQSHHQQQQQQQQQKQQQQDLDLYYVQKYSTEAEKATSTNQHRAAADALAKAIKHERQRREKGFAMSPHQLALLLQKRSGALAQVGGDKNFESALCDAQEAVAMVKTDAKIQARYVQSLLALKRNRSARQALDEAIKDLSAEQQKNDAFVRAKSAVEATEQESKAQQQAALDEEAQARRELEAALRSRGKAEVTRVDTLKKRKVDESVNEAMCHLGGGNKHTAMYCRFCNGSHATATCPLKRQQ